MEKGDKGYEKNKRFYTLLKVTENFSIKGSEITSTKIHKKINLNTYISVRFLV